MTFWMTRDFVKNRSTHSRQVSNSIPIPTPPRRPTSLY